MGLLLVSCRAWPSPTRHSFTLRAKGL